MRTPDESHLRGDVLWGDDFTEPEREEWFRDEANAYTELYAANPNYEYGYDKVNRALGYRYLPRTVRFGTVLGLGSAFGDELRPIANRADRIVVVESSDHYSTRANEVLPIEWRRAQPSGDLPMRDGEADLSVCLGVLHHIPNVSHVVHELARVTAHGGWCLLREPIISMGDWRRPRQGLTPRERGIPRTLLLSVVDEAGFKVEHERLCFFAPLQRIGSRAGLRPTAFEALVRLDAALASATLFNYRYHAESWWQKIRPTSSFLTLRRQ